MSEPITKELRERIEAVCRATGLEGGDLFNIADRIDRAHKTRMEDCRRETRRALVRYLRGVLNDYDRGIKRVRKGDRVEVVRCHDCKRSIRFSDGSVGCARWEEPVEPDGYCSNGERREVDG